MQICGYLFFFLPRWYYKHWHEPKKETQILLCRISGLCTEMLKFRHNRKPPSSVLLLRLAPRLRMGYSYRSTLPLCHVAGYKGKKLAFTFRIAYMRETENKNIHVTWIPLVRSRVLVEMTVMAVMISPVKETASLSLPIYGIRQELITMLRRAQKWPRLN